MEFKDRIKNLRSQSNFTTQKLGEMLGKTDAAIRMWETGRSKPDADTLIKLAEIFDCTTDYLLGVSDTKSRRSSKRFVSRYQQLGEQLSTMNGGNGFMSALTKIISSDAMSEEIFIFFQTAIRLIAEGFISAEIFMQDNSYGKAIEKTANEVAGEYADLYKRIFEYNAHAENMMEFVFGGLLARSSDKLLGARSDVAFIEALPLERRYSREDVAKAVKLINKIKVSEQDV